MRKALWVLVGRGRRGKRLLTCFARSASLMNKIYRIIRNRKTGLRIAVSETSKAAGKGKSSQPRSLLAVCLIGASLCMQAATAAPLDDVWIKIGGVTGGSPASAPVQGAIAIGSSTEASTNATAVGSRAKAQAVGSGAIGLDAIASGVNANAFGVEAKAANRSALSIGYRSSAAGFASTAIGEGALASQEDAIALGRSSQATGARAVALGYAATAEAMNATALGTGSHATHEGA
ncbi:hypothetical protein CEK28_17680 [Xenophilus sp. AP218F]|nr:hypothetical protein CEK28_17680 [Xenophilus sp. AP218F]